MNSLRDMQKQRALEKRRKRRKEEMVMKPVTLHTTTTGIRWVMSYEKPRPKPWQTYLLIHAPVIEITSCSPAIQAIFDRNNATSRFLQLPMEIKSRIYTHLLTGQNVCIYPNSIRRRFATIESDPGDAEYEKVGEDMSYYSHLKHNVNAADDCLTLLWRTCRLMYADTALWHYSSNTFFFHDSRTMRRWMDFRTPAQKAALKSIDLTNMEMSAAFVQQIPAVEEVYFRGEPVDADRLFGRMSTMSSVGSSGGDNNNNNNNNNNSNINNDAVDDDEDTDSDEVELNLLGGPPWTGDVRRRRIDTSTFKKMYPKHIVSIG